MKIIALNSSPRGGGESKTAWMLNHLVEGMRQAGADVETVHLREKTINFCVGCFTCWTQTPGQCLHKDDMTRELFPKWLAADIAVYATPLYHYTMNAAMKAFVERTLPVLEPFFEVRDGRTQHPLRHLPPKAVWISVAGFPEMSVFDQLSAYLHFVFGDRLLAELYRPAAESLMQPGCEQIRQQVTAALHAAGGQLVAQQRIDTKLLDEIGRPLGTTDDFANVGNAFWKTCIREGVSPKSFGRKGLVPRPDNAASFLSLLKMGFNPEAARDTRAIVQFDFSGDNAAQCHIVIDRGRLDTAAGPADRPDLTVASPFEVWMDIMTGKADGQQMFMEQRYTADGDFNLLMKFREFFGRR